MDLIAELEYNRSNRIKGLFDSNVINNTPNLEYMSDPFINFDQAQIQDILDKGTGRVSIQIENGSISASVLMINDILEEKRLRHNPDLITSFYTLLEYGPWAHQTKHLVAGNLTVLSQNAQYFPDSWFPIRFIRILGKLLNYYSSAKNQTECLNIYRILYFAIKKNIRLNSDVILQSCKRSFLSVKYDQDPFDLFLVLLATHNSCQDVDQNVKTLVCILDLMNTYRGAKLLSGNTESSLLIRAEWALILQNSDSYAWVRLTSALIKSYHDDQVFDDYFSLVLTYQEYSNCVLTYRNSKWSIVQVLFQDSTVDSFVKNCDWLYSEIIKMHTIGTLNDLKIGESCALISILLGMRVPFLEDLQTAEVKAFAGILSDLIKRNESFGAQNSSSVKDQLCAFIAAEFFQTRTAWPLDNDMKNYVCVSIHVLLDDDQLLELPINFYETLNEGAKDISLIGNDPMWALLKERSSNPAVLFASAGRIAKAASHFASYLCDMNSYKIIDGMLGRLQKYSQNLHDSFHSSIFPYGTILSNPDFKVHANNFWRYFQTIAFCISVILRSVAFDLPDSTNNAKKKSMSYVSKILMILSNIHFVTLRYGPTGFSLWRDIMDRCMISVKLNQNLVPPLLESLNVKSSSSVSFLLDITRYLLPQLSESKLDQVLHGLLLPGLRQLQKKSDPIGEYDKALQDSGFLLIKELFESPLKFKDILLKFWLPFFHHILSNDKLSHDSVEKSLLGLIKGLSTLSDPLENADSHEIWDAALVKLLRESQIWIESEWNVSGATDKARTICRLLISSLEVIPYKHTPGLLKWISNSITSKKDGILLSIEDSLQKEDQMNNGRRPWLVYQFKALL